MTIPTDRQVIPRKRASSCCHMFESVNSLHHMASLNVDRLPLSIRRTALVATLGPASQKVEVLKELLRAGVSICRLNFSHGTYEYHRQSIDNVREAERQLAGAGIRPVAIALDTKGPEIRTGVLVDSAEIVLVKGQKVNLVADEKYKECSTAENLFVTYAKISNVLKAGRMVYIDDGLLCLTVDETLPGVVRCTVVNGGKLSNQKGVNLPGTPVDLPVVSEKDIEDLKFGVANNVDFVFASFIRNAEGVREIRKVLGEEGRHIKIISKIENCQGLENIDSIIRESDGIMVARGDMGIEIPAQKVFVAQKTIIARCNLAGKPVICATQMLESMTYNPRPTRAEVSDVANAVMDGADSVMLSGESAKGLFPVECVRLMHEIAKEAEACIFYREVFENLRYFTPPPIDAGEATSIAAVEASFRVYARVILVLTSTGTSARQISKYRPMALIMAISRNEQTARALAIHRGCFAVHYTQQCASPDAATAVGQTFKRQTNVLSSSDDVAHMDAWLVDVDARVREGMRIAKQNKFLEKGEAVVVVTGWKAGSGLTNTIRIMYSD